MPRTKREGLGWAGRSYSVGTIANFGRVQTVYVVAGNPDCQGPQQFTNVLYAEV